MFVCYASVDAGVAQRMVESLERDGIRCWLAPRDVAPGSVYIESIAEGVTGARAVVFLMSSGSVESPHCLRELELADRRRLPVLPVHLGGPATTVRSLDAQGVAEQDWHAQLRDALDDPMLRSWIAPDPSEIARAGGADESGSWVFVSHSNEDFERVRAVRNTLEDLGHRPLLFYLLCLEAEDGELPDLLRREIEARRWFVLCDSPSAQSSPWVQRELEIIRGLPDGVFASIDLASSPDEQRRVLEALSKQATVYICTANALGVEDFVALHIAAALRSADYNARRPEDLSPAGDEEGGGPKLAEEMAVVEQAIETGWVVVVRGGDGGVVRSTERILERAVAGEGRVLVLELPGAGVAPGTLPYLAPDTLAFDPDDMERSIGTVLDRLRLGGQEVR